ncbi:hypothetical protein M3196_00220 [Fictibacillus nanhaiensis]|uniref:hypothetical protein n=1 Tax=Fictibacillus nanhaiensis TaxID=742169 RepID=UPI00203CDB81|nr:hypothetical protein [Fictibacillus nanhaiensis]MCM3730094.1 hypothetical protein [Fictibacillus nanhaiensis]
MLEIAKKNKLVVLALSVILVSATIGKVSSVAANIIIFIMFIIYFFLVSKDLAMHIWSICCYLILAPLISFGFLGTLIIEITTDVNKQIANEFVEQEYKILFVFILLISTCFILLFKNDEFFLDRVKVSTRVNNAFFLILTSSTIYYAYSTNDFSHIFPEDTLLSLKEFNLDARSAFLTGINFIFLPYLISNAILMALVEYLQYREKLKTTNK